MSPEDFNWSYIVSQAARMGLDRHLWNIPLSVASSDDFLKLVYILNWLYEVSVTFVQLTFFVLYWNIFKPFRWLKFAIAIGGVLVTQSCRSKRGDNYELTVYSEQGVTTEVYSEPPGEVSEGVIHMKVELEQY
ncbi:MAG: hypothetical protein LQ343_000101 [Gyalolechia ehrenbergii]|nr:MAG: hypothetical protein LQ343_000101 [Gyalolechia ehrenbergii]